MAPPDHEHPYWGARGLRCVDKKDAYYFLLFLSFLICFFQKIAYKIIDVNRSGTEQILKTNGISIHIFRRFIILPNNKHNDAIS